ncbi:MAG: MaoC/PaaZ C-terminal domain-containing protein [Candidatus Nanopelagicales bacterium]
MSAAQISVGDVVPALDRTITLPDMVAYAGATWDWHRLHYDPAYLAQKKLPAPVVDGQLFGALLAEQLQDWLGPAAVLRRLHFRFKNLVFAGETVRCTATVAVVDAVGGGTLVTVTSQVDVLGTQGRIAVAPAGAEVLIRTDLGGAGTVAP